MVHFTGVGVVLAYAVSLALAQSNLPDVPPGVFNASTRIEIDAPLEKVWNAVVNFTDYPNWSPFVRSQIVADDFFVPLANQTAVEGRRLIINVQIPPLPLPVNASTPPNPLHSQISLENITAVQPELGRVAWGQIFIPSAILDAVRWSAVSKVGNKTLYESREVYGGPLAYAVQDLYGEGLQEAFDATGVALKALLEG
ncbi:hypothetical protein PLICRDRAFT_314879 [Plicaturopsis crispa FD-325 SS-3]|nr:hypothetical protein PLICRDRAFT_314879 [Plicaturopsis crispa FD-325 SS-3]